MTPGGNLNTLQFNNNGVLDGFGTWNGTIMGIGGTTLSSDGTATFGNGNFVVNTSGNITTLNGIATNFPSSQGGVGQVLTNDGSGNLTWQNEGAFTSPFTL